MITFDSCLYQFIWSFPGIVLFELYSYGETPYKKLKTQHVLGYVVSFNFFQHLLNNAAAEPKAALAKYYQYTNNLGERFILTLNTNISRIVIMVE